MDRKYFTNQTSVNDCGAACLTMILKLFDIKVSLDDIKDKLKIKEDGVSAYDIINLSKEYDICATGYKNCTLENIKLPAIVHVINKNNLQHFMVLLKVLKDKILVADPASSICFVSKEKFKEIYTGIAILFENKKDKIEFKKEKIIAIKTIFLTLFLSIITVVSSYLFTNALKIFSNYYNQYQALAILAIFFIVSIVKEIVNFIREKLSLNFESLIDKKITINTLKKLIYLPYKFYHQNGSGEFISKINDLSYIKEMIYMVVEVLSINFMFGFCILVILFIVNKFLFIINLLFILLFYFFNRNFSKRYFYDTYNLQIKNEVLNGKIGDFVNGVLTIKNLSKEDYFSNDFEENYKDFLDDNKRLTSNYHKKNLITSIFTLLFNVIIFLILLYEKFSMYEALFVISIEDILINSLGEFYKVQMLYNNFKSAYERLKFLRKENMDNLNYNTYFEIRNILFKNLNYSKDGVRILSNINFSISKGEWIMINGDTGSGKSTLFKLLTKQLIYDKKGIYINGKSINNYSYNEIRNKITYVDQKAKLFNRKVSDNIYFEGTKDDKISRFLIKNKIDENIVINSTNSNISGGQMQKIIIAQALINSGDVIIFDETTNQIDVESEREILEFIKEEYKNKTIILVSHRKSNSFLFDKIIDFKDGKAKIMKGVNR